VAALRHNTASYLPAVLLFGVLLLTAPSLFVFVSQLVRPLFEGLLANSPTGTAPGSWFLVAAPLLKLLGAGLGLAMLASLTALVLRRALVR